MIDDRINLMQKPNSVRNKFEMIQNQHMSMLKVVGILIIDTYLRRKISRVLNLGGVLVLAPCTLSKVLRTCSKPFMCDLLQKF